jgi:hypothetical protein
MSANAKERLLGVQSKLEELGAKDVKFCFAHTEGKPLSMVANEVADALQARLDGKFRPLKAFDDGKNT